MDGAGIEPATHGFSVRSNLNAINEAVKTCVKPENRVAFCVALLAEGNGDLAKVVAAWPTLPEPIRRAIVAMVDAAAG